MSRIQRVPDEILVKCINGLWDKLPPSQFRAICMELLQAREVIRMQVKKDSSYKEVLGEMINSRQERAEKIVVNGK